MCWHTSTNRIVGLALTHDELATLADVYEQLANDKPKKTTYILQFLWRDVSSKFDLIGPFFTSESGLDTRFTAACLFEVMRSLEAVGFQIVCLICDGASSNLTLLKNLCGVRGQFGYNLSDSDPFAVSCSFKNPFSDDTVWCIVCPTHQVIILSHA